MTREEARRRLSGILTEAVESENSVCYVTEEDREPLEMAIKALEEPKTGHWYYDEEREATGIYAICSNCDEVIYQTGDFKYCPNCGAKMK